MAIAFDAAGAGESSSSSPATWSHVGVGSSLVALAVIAVGASATAPSTFTRTVTFGGVTMTSLGAVNSGSGADNGFIEFFGLLDAPSGSRTVSATVSGGTVVSVIGDSVTYTGVGGIGTLVSAASSSPGSAATVSVPSATGRYVVGGIAAGNSISAPTLTQRFLTNRNSSTRAGNLLIEDAIGASTVTVAGTVAADHWVAAGVSLTPAGGQSTGQFFTLL